MQSDGICKTPNWVDEIINKKYSNTDGNCPLCGGEKDEWRILPGNPYTDLYAGDFCPHEFHGPRPGYNCF